ncbi:MAG: hypothetical protein GX905_10190 [Bacteroidales bacterium]|nr:hypothetical protein [Bacteroidales bacterium]
MNKYLVLKGCAGLGNRLITLTNAIQYATSSNRVLLVDWADGMFRKKGENVFYDYFDIKGVTHIKSINEIETFIPKTCYPRIWGQNPKASVYDLYEPNHANFLLKFFPSKLHGRLALPHGYWQLKQKSSSTINRDWLTIKAFFNRNNIPYGGKYSNQMKEDVVFFADYIPPFSGKFLKKHIEPVSEIQREINNLANEWKLYTNTIGVHVRMTDKQPSNSLQYLKEKISHLNLENYQIFLATDNIEAEEFFQSNFKNIVFTKKWRPNGEARNKGIHQYASRNEDYEMAERQLRESIIDMWLLSKCEYLIWQENSSFSRVSAVLKNEPSKTFSW